MEKTVTLEEALKRIEELEKENVELQFLPKLYILFFRLLNSF